jgi:2-polyprenyl-3-methyl-5-hydroxy-6-metoxy-1,4-benzoquinol methylase
MKQTLSHDSYNKDLLSLLQTRAFEAVVEVGCSRGALAQAYRNVHRNSRYTGVELESENAQAARQHCTRVISGNIEHLGSSEWESLFPSDCWVFGDSLEHLHDPWSLLRRLRQSLPTNAHVFACIPNSQHWSVQARLAAGVLRYEDSGLLDRSHLRWFTRITIIELFASSGFKIAQLIPRIFPEPPKDHFLAAIRSVAAAGGANPDQAVQDALPMQYIVIATPA